MDPPRALPFETVRRSPRNSRKASRTDTRFDSAPLDPAQAVRTRARRRLIGAVALALAAIVFVPLLFDRAPAPTDDIALQIPDRDTPFEGRSGVPRAQSSTSEDPSRVPLKPASDLPVIAPAPTEPPAVAAPEPTGRSADKDGPKTASVAKIDRSLDARTPEPSADKPTNKPTSLPGDDPRAIAALEGKSDGAASSVPTGAVSSVPSGAKTFAVQVAAYAAPDKARGMRDQLVAAGLKSYVESVSTPQGLRTRVRLGPFPSREAADHARAKLQTMKLDGSVVPL